jgi:hypothetical protein
VLAGDRPQEPPIKVLKALAEINVNIDVVGVAGSSAGCTGNYAYTDQEPEGGIQGLATGVVGKGLLGTKGGLPPTDTASNPSKMQPDERGEKNNGAERVILFRDELNSKLFDQSCVCAEILRDP